MGSTPTTCLAKPRGGNRIKQFLTTDSVRLNDTFEKTIETVGIVQGSGFIREGDEFNSYSQFNQIYAEMAGVSLRKRREVENYLARIGLYFVDNGSKKVITRVGDEVGNMLYDYYLQNDEAAISRMNHTWQGENRERINHFLRERPWTKIEGRLRYSDYGLSRTVASALFMAKPETRLFEITEADFEIKMPEDSLWKIDRIYKIVGNAQSKRADISCVCGKKMKMYEVPALENGAALNCRSCSNRTTDFIAFYQSISDEGYTVVKDFEDTRPTAFSRITLQCSDSSHQEYSTFQNRWMNMGARCPACSLNHVGEKKAREFLQSKDIQFKEQVKFDGLVGTGSRKLSYDFMIELNGESILLEIDGEQHFKLVEDWGGETLLQRNIEHDRLKTNFAAQNDLRLVRIQNIGSNYGFILESLELVLSGSIANYYGSLYQKKD